MQTSGHISHLGVQPYIHENVNTYDVSIIALNSRDEAVDKGPSPVLAVESEAEDGMSIWPVCKRLARPKPT